MMIDLPTDEYLDEADVEYLPLYYFNLTPRLIQQAKEELFEDSNKTKRTLNELRTLIIDSDKDNMDYPTDDEELMPFLRARKHDVKKAYAMYKIYFAQFRTYDVLFKDFDFSYNLKIPLSNCAGFLPQRDAEGCIVAVTFCEYWDPGQFSPKDLLRATTVALMDIIRCPITQITGVKLIADHKGISLSQLASVRPWHVRYVAEVIQKSTPLRFKEYHMFNNSKLGTVLWNMIKPMLSQKIIDRVHFHGQNVKSLHRFFPPSILPREFGGTRGPFNNDGDLERFARAENYITTRINKFSSKRS